jgi:REG-2-like HAD superfamily hydrolase
MPSPVRFVYFDAAFTLFEPWPSVGAVYAGAAVDAGLRVDAEQLDAAFFPAWRANRSRVPRGRPPYGRTDAESRVFWRGVVADAFAGCGHALPPDPFFDGLYDRFATAACWRLFDDTREALALCRDRGVGVGVLSNFDPRLRPLLESLGIEGLFDVVVVSCEVGLEKPDQGIYKEAARLAGHAPAHIAMVGDEQAADCDGPRAAGWRACRINRRDGAPSADGVPAGADAYRSLPSAVEYLLA